MWTLLFLLTALAWAQPADAPKPVFLDDSQDPKQASGAELLEAVCPGHVVVGEDVECKTCPGPGGADNWILHRVLRGHFLSPTSDDAVLSMAWCEPHEQNFGGTILLSRQAGKWTMLWYRAGVPTDDCHRTKLESQREILVCIGSTSDRLGHDNTDLYVEDLLVPKGALLVEGGTDFFAIGSNTDSCGYNYENESKPFPITRGYIERVEFQIAADATFRALSVFGRRGERTMTPAQVKACLKGISFNPPTKSYRVDFKFDGTRMVRVTSSPGAPK